MAKEHLPEKKYNKKRTRDDRDLNKFLETMVEWANYRGKSISQCLFFTSIVHKKDSWERAANFFAVGFFPLEFLIIELFAYLVSFHLAKKIEIKAEEKEKKGNFNSFWKVVCKFIKVELETHKKVLQIEVFSSVGLNEIHQTESQKRINPQNKVNER